MGDKGVRVVCRFRPQNDMELTRGGLDITRFESSGTGVTLEGQRKAAFTFDRVFQSTSTQQEVYEYTAKSIVEDVLKGYNGTIFAYGQTSSGKTFTMEGPDINGPMKGVIPRIVHNVFQYIEIAPETYEFTVRVSYFEIYNEKIRDLLCDGNDNLQIHENRERGVYVRHATELFMQDPEGVMDVMHSGAERRSVASTSMNDLSSRSHSVFLMELTQKDTIKGGVKTGKLYLVDLAGSEKICKTGAQGEVLEEAKNINKSLSALGLVIMTLTDGQRGGHVPYRDSKLTRILQESLGGNSRTTIIICASPSSYNEQETFSSLRFGQRAKKIKNCAKVNVQYSAEELTKKLESAKKEIKRLAKKLQSAQDELNVWRSGGQVSEDDRIKLADGVKITLDDDEEESPIPALAKQAEINNFNEQEREEMLRRETELLNLLDDKDEHLHQLEREIETLAQDKVTITKLAAESSQQRAKLKDLEERLDELNAENTEYEMTIDDMARINNSLEEKCERIQEEKSKIDNDFKQQATKVHQQTATIAEMVAALSSLDGQGGPSDSGTVVDAQISKARAFITELKNDLKEAGMTKEQVEQQAIEVEAELEATKKLLGEFKLQASQVEEKLTNAQGRISSFENDNKTLAAEKGELEEQINDLMAKLEKANTLVDRTKELAEGDVSKREEQIEEMQAELEKQRKLQREQHTKQLSDLQQQIADYKEKEDTLIASKDKLEREIVGLKADLENSKTQAAKQEEKLQEFSQKAEEIVKVERKTRGITEATTQQLEAYDGLKEKMRANLLARCKQAMGQRAAMMGGDTKDEKGSVPVFSEQHSKHVEYLEKTNKDLTTQQQKIKTANADLQLQLAVLQKQLAARTERVSNLEKLMREREEKRSREEAGRVQKQRQTQRAVVRRKSMRVSGGDIPQVVRGRSSVSVTDNTKANFWDEQKQTDGGDNPLAVEFV